MGTQTKYPNKAGIYKLTCIDTNKVYIGKSIDLNRRLEEHRKCNYKSKGIFYLQSAILKYGWDSFTVEILEISENFDKLKDNILLLERESYYIELFKSTDAQLGYNLCKSSNDRTGILHSEEAKAKMSQANLGKILSEETKNKIRKSCMGRIVSKETKDKLSKLRLGQPNHRLGKTHSEETKNKIRKSNSGKPSNRLGMKLSEEHKEKMRKPKSEEHKVNMRKPKSEETKEKMKLRKHSEETKEKMRKSKLGKPRSQETKDKIRHTLSNKINLN